MHLSLMSPGKANPSLLVAKFESHAASLGGTRCARSIPRVKKLSIAGLLSSTVTGSPGEILAIKRHAKRNAIPSRCTAAMARDGGALPRQLEEDGKFVPISELQRELEEDSGSVPATLLLLGYPPTGVASVLQMLSDMDGDFVKVLTCTEEMMRRTLREAIAVVQKDPRKVQGGKGLPKVCFLAGMTSEEIMMVIDAFNEIAEEIEPPAFAAVVANNRSKLLSELVEEVMGDHETLKKR